MNTKLKVLDVGGNDGKRAREEFYPNAEVTVLDLKTGYDVMSRGLPEDDWDVILANHFIEHIEDPDFFLDECKKVMREKTLLNIGTPNLAAWFNRILFLWGYVPHSVELSKRYNVGKPFNWGAEPLGGHLHVFTMPALKSLLKIHGFKILSIEGERSTYPCYPFIHGLVHRFDGFFTKISPTLASAFRIKCVI